MISHMFIYIFVALKGTQLSEQHITYTNAKLTGNYNFQMLQLRLSFILGNFRHQSRLFSIIWVISEISQGYFICRAF